METTLKAGGSAWAETRNHMASLSRRVWQKVWICAKAVGSVVWPRQQTVHQNLCSLFHSKARIGKQLQSKPSLCLGEAMWFVLANGP